MNQKTKLKLFRAYYLFQNVLLILYLIAAIPATILLLIIFFLIPDVWNDRSPSVIKGYLTMATIILSTFGIPLIIFVFSRKAAKNLSLQNKLSVIQIIAAILYPFSSCFVWFILYKFIMFEFFGKL